MENNTGTSIRILKSTRKRLKQALSKTDFKSYDEWINEKLNEETTSKKK